MTDIIEWAARQVIEEQIAVLDGTDVASLPPALRIGIAAYGKATRGLLEDPSAVAGMFDWTAYPMPESAMRSCTRRVLRNLAKAGMMEEYPPYVRGAKVTDSTMWRRSP